MCIWNNSLCHQRNLVVECRATLQQLDQDQLSLAEPSAGQCDRALRNDQNHKCWRPKFLMQCLHTVPTVQSTKTKFQFIYGKTNGISLLAAPAKLMTIRNVVFPHVRWFSCIFIIVLFCTIINQTSMQISSGLLLSLNKQSLMDHSKHNTENTWRQLFSLVQTNAQEGKKSTKTNSNTNQLQLRINTHNNRSLKLNQQACVRTAYMSVHTMLYTSKCRATLNVLNCYSPHNQHGSDVYQKGVACMPDFDFRAIYTYINLLTYKIHGG